MARPERFIRRAQQVSTNTSCTFLVGAVIARGSRIVSTGCCSKKTHPQNPKLKSPTKRNQLCAEVKTALKALKLISSEEIKKCTIYVARSRKDGSMAMAKPCSHCLSFLREVGIKNVYYTNSTGAIQHMEN